MPNDRRDFIKQVSAGAAVAAVVAKATEQVAEAAIADKRGFVAGKFALELDGEAAGWIYSAEGGHAVADVVTEKVGEDGIARKHLANFKYEDISITCGANMSKAFFEWVKASFDRKHIRKDGSIVATDFNFNTLTVLKFSNALISEIGFPALDASSKDAAKLTLKFAPEFTEYKHTVANAIIPDPVDFKQKKWLASNFRLKIDGLDESSTRVAKIDAITIKQKISENPVGENRDFDQELTSLDYSNLKITLPEHNAEDLFGWHEDFVIKGNNGQDKEKTGTLEYLTPDLKTTLFALDFHQLGIFKLTPEPLNSDSDRLRKVDGEMYVEEIKFRPAGIKPSVD